MVDEVSNDTGIIPVEIANLYPGIFKKSQEGVLEQIALKGLKKVPRYVSLNFTTPPYKEDVSIGKINQSQEQNILNNIVYEDEFASDYFTTININNLTIEQQNTSNVNLYKDAGTGTVFQNIVKTIKNNFDDYQNSAEYASEISSNFLQSKDYFFTKNLVENSKFADLKKLRFDLQISNNVIYDFFAYASGSFFSNNQFYKNNLDFAANKVDKNPKFTISDDDYKPSIKIYQEGISVSDDLAAIKKTLIGFLIQKAELKTDGTTKNVETILLKDGNKKSYVDFKIRYGTIYVYKIRALFEIKYPAVDTDLMEFYFVNSVIASKPSVSYTETIENVSPPPPVELRFVWDYDRINLNTTEFLPNTNIHLENFGSRGSLMIYWSFPSNPRMDIKKFQVFRRKSIDEPFELIKMYDFNDSIFKYDSLENLINPDLVQRSLVNRIYGPDLSLPISNYYDDDFYKNSEYIYSVASINAHGLTSNYSEQIKVRFDQFSNKIETSLVSIAGAPKQYPNLYLNQDLFLDTIKMMNKKSLNIYFTPDCFSVTSKNSDKKIIDIKDENLKYVFNFINTDKALGSNLKISLNNLQTK
ncbi:MAG: hypothetical protein FJ077_07045 [Cyanobacteria bacterium K_DeepCast_35m_m2_023]|nr:hypothetical protein [Cyanobacteria bacterium K_DeepCast_35m_m2_023]